MKNLLILTITFFSLTVISQSDLKSFYLLENLASEHKTVEDFPQTPGTTISTPTGYGADWGDIYVGANIVNASRGNDAVDGSMILGMGFWDDRKYVGIDVSLNMVDMIGDFGQEGSFNLKVHRKVYDDLSVSLGISDMFDFGNDNFQRYSAASFYAAVSKMFVLRDKPFVPFYALAVHLGIGNGKYSGSGSTFRAKQFNDLALYGHNNEESYDYNPFGRKGDSYSPFLSLGLGLTRWANFVLSWNAQDLDLGFSFAPFRDLPLVATLSAKDVAGTACPNCEVRYGLSVGYNYDFKKDHVKQVDSIPLGSPYAN